MQKRNEIMNRKERRRQEKAAKAKGGFQPGPAKPSQVSNALFAYATGQSGSPMDMTQAAAPLPVDYDPVQEGLQKAAELLAQNDHASLNAHCQSLLDAHPEHPDVHYVTGLTAFVMNDLRRAEEHLQKAIDGGTEYAEASLYLGDVRVQEKRYVEGEELIRRALAREPDNDEFKMRLVLALQNQFKMSEAIEIYESLGPAMKENPDVQYNMGHAYYQADRIDEADRCYRRCVEMDPIHRMGLIGLGTTNLAAGRNDEAKAAFEKSLAQDPTDAEALLGLAKALRALLDYAAAADTYRAAINAAVNNADAYWEMGSVLAELGRTEEARTAYQQCLQFDPNNVTAKRLMAELDG